MSKGHGEDMPMNKPLFADLQYEGRGRIVPVLVELIGGKLFVSVRNPADEQADSLRLVVELDHNEKLTACCY